MNPSLRVKSIVLFVEAGGVFQQLLLWMSLECDGVPRIAAAVIKSPKSQIVSLLKPFSFRVCPD